MIDNPKEKNPSGQDSLRASKKSSVHYFFGKSAILADKRNAVPVISAALQIVVGLLLVGISILGLIQPIWFSAILSLAGSISCMAGVYLIYHTMSSNDTFESLINKAVKRVVKDQN